MTSTTSHPGARPLTWFLTLLVVFSLPVWLLAIHAGSELPMLSRAVMWCPGAAALTTCLICGIDIRSLGWRWPAARFVAAGYWIPWVYAVPVYVATWACISGSCAWSDFASKTAQPYLMSGHQELFAALFGIPTTMLFIVIGTMAWALGEELGWRGFLLPRLASRLGITGGGVVSGLIWAAWHYPVLLGADYNAGTPPIYALACFTLMVVGAGIITAWLRMASGSIWPCVIWHAAHNTLVQAVLDAMTAKTGPAPYITTEFGVGMAVLICVVAAVTVAWGRRQHSFG